MAHQNDIGIHFAKEADGFGIGGEAGDGEFSYVCFFYVLVLGIFTRSGDESGRTFCRVLLASALKWRSAPVSATAVTVVEVSLRGPGSLSLGFLL